MRPVKIALQVALLALLAGGVPSALAGRTATNALTIEIAMESAGSWYTGTFRASGAISDRGSVVAFDYGGSGYAQWIELDGADGSLTIAIDDIVLTGEQTDGTTQRVEMQLSGTFAVVGSTGAYAGFEPAGPATGTRVSYPGHCRKGQPGPCGDRKPAEWTWMLSLAS